MIQLFSDFLIFTKGVLGLVNDVTKTLIFYAY